MEDAVDGVNQEEDLEMRDDSEDGDVPVPHVEAPVEVLPTTAKHADTKYLRSRWMWRRGGKSVPRWPPT